MSIEEDGLLWLHACYPRGADYFNAEDMLRAYEAGRAYPTTSCWKMREGWYGGPAQDVSREGEAGSRSATKPDANLPPAEGDASRSTCKVCARPMMDNGWGPWCTGCGLLACCCYDVRPEAIAISMTDSTFGPKVQDSVDVTFEQPLVTVCNHGETKAHWFSAPSEFGLAFRERRWCTGP